MVRFLHAPRVWGPIPYWPRREPYFLSSHMLYLTSQRTKLSDFWCYGILIIKTIARKMGQKEQVVGELCKLMCCSP